MHLAEALGAIIAPDRVLTRRTDIAVYATDASLYRIPPRAAVRPDGIEEIRALLAFARREGVPLTFRAAGTSLSGQALGEGIVVDVSRHWRKLEVLDGGRRLRAGPGVVGGFANGSLAPHGFKLGPDPASIDACMIGGIVANNSSGMCCGIDQNAFRTLESLVLVLPSGTLVDSAADGASARLREAEPAIWSGIARLRDRVRGDPELSARIRRKYVLKNTMGYALNAFTDFDDPLEILWHLVVGSEGTLAFVAEAVFRTVPDLAHKAAGLLFFRDVRAACGAIGPLRATGAAALELMDRASLRSVEGKPGVPPLVASLPDEAAALLVEHQAASAEALDVVLPELPLIGRTEVTRDPWEQAALWAVRKGIIPSVGARRRRGTTLVTEDVVFPVEDLADGVLGLQGLFRRHGYDDAVVFGHAKDGNLHFLLAQDMDDAGRSQLGAFTDGLVDLVVRRHAGALKAEHGTGRNMAPFVEAEWGQAAYAVMKAVKELVDPDGVLNPGVLINADPEIHLKSFKSLPKIEDEADACIECGFCEPKCPSRDLTLTPRGRIVVRRERARLIAAGRDAEAFALDTEAAYDVVATCAADGLCATACPVAIDTGALVKRLRAEGHTPVARAAAGVAVSAFGLLESAVRAAARLGIRDLPGAALPLPRSRPDRPDAVYWPSCVTRTLRGADPPLAATILAVAGRAGLRLLVPEDVAGTCCGMPFASKGFPEAAARARAHAAARVRAWSNEGAIPVFSDTSPCAYTMRGEVLDGIAFAHDVVLPRLTIRRSMGVVAIHPVCSAVKLGLSQRMTSLVGRCADEVFVPPSAGCCGFAGDRGFLVPELTQAATAAEAREIASRGPASCVSSSRTCEIGLARATGRPWRSIWHLLDEASR